MYVNYECNYGSVTSKRTLPPLTPRAFVGRDRQDDKCPKNARRGWVSTLEIDWAITLHYITAIIR